jgi:hypothetical protein
MLANIIREEKIELERPNTPWDKNGNLLVNAEISFWMVEKQEKGVFLPDYKRGYQLCQIPEEPLKETVNHEIKIINLS